jgi:hypothetical protein
MVDIELTENRQQLQVGEVVLMRFLALCMDFWLPRHDLHDPDLDACWRRRT